MKRVYVASAFEDYQRTRMAQRFLREHGIEISYDWTQHVENYPRDDASPEVAFFHAQEDRRGVNTANALLLLTPDSKEKGCGCWIELGIAIEKEVPIFISGVFYDRSIFCRYSKFRALDDSQALFALVSFLETQKV